MSLFNEGWSRTDQNWTQDCQSIVEPSGQGVQSGRIVDQGVVLAGPLAVRRRSLLARRKCLLSGRRRLRSARRIICFQGHLGHRDFHILYA
jgi:hypothetical protein